MLSFDFNNWLATGEMAGVERRAAERAIREERESWLPTLEAFQATLTADDNPLVVIIIDGEIRRLRRLLGLPAPISAATVERRRNQTRERVRRFRQRQKAAE